MHLISLRHINCIKVCIYYKIFAIFQFTWQSSYHIFSIIIIIITAFIIFAESLPRPSAYIMTFLINVESFIFVSVLLLFRNYDVIVSNNTYSEMFEKLSLITLAL
jgi:hypothetical protein